MYWNCLYACSSSLGRAEDFMRLLIVMESRPELSASFAEGVFRTAIRAMLGFCLAEDVHRTLAGCLKHTDSSRVHLAALILSIGKEQIQELAAVIVDCTRDTDNPIIMVTAMRALHAMGRCDNLILEGLSSANTIIQIAAIRNCEHCVCVWGGGVEYDVAQLLSSPSFDVRYAAAMTLRSMQGKGLRLLRDAQDGHADPYARTMATFALALE
ncbi:MAG: hypothetical protein ACYDDT_11675 [Sulfuricella sp.]